MFFIRLCFVFSVVQLYTKLSLSNFHYSCCATLVIVSYYLFGPINNWLSTLFIGPIWHIVSPPYVWAQWWYFITIYWKILKCLKCAAYPCSQTCLINVHGHIKVSCFIIPFFFLSSFVITNLEGETFQITFIMYALEVFVPLWWSVRSVHISLYPYLDGFNVFFYND